MNVGKQWDVLNQAEPLMKVLSRERLSECTSGMLDAEPFIMDEKPNEIREFNRTLMLSIHI